MSDETVLSPISDTNIDLSMIANGTESEITISQQPVSIDLDAIRTKVSQHNFEAADSSEDLSKRDRAIEKHGHLLESNTPLGQPSLEIPCDLPIETCEMTETTEITRTTETIQSPEHEILLQPKKELPLVVWLRGDEDHAGDFTLNAESAMEELGIKRSRLTQISGKELRVGRMRIDRYIRPVYRPIDIETYKNWSRATATHQKSSGVLNDAAKHLETQGNLIGDRVAASLNISTTALQEQLQEIMEILQLEKAEFLSSIGDFHHDLTGKVSDLEICLAKETEKICDELSSIRTASEQIFDLHEKIDSVKDELETVIKKDQDIHTENQLQLAVMNKNQQQLGVAVGKALEIIIEQQSDLAKRQDGLINSAVEKLMKANQQAAISEAPTSNRRISMHRMRRSRIQNT